MAIVQQDRVATFLFKKTPFTPDDVEQLRRTSANLGFTVLYAPGQRDATNDYAKLVLAPDRFAFYESYHHDVAPTTDNRPFFFHTTKIKDQFQTAFGRSMLFGNGLSALMTLMAISAAFVTLFVVGPLLVSGSELRGSQWPLWLGYFGMLGAGFMLIEVALLQRFVLLLGHPVYSLTVTLFSVLLGTGIGSLISRRVSDASLLRTLQLVLLGIVGVAFLAIFALPPIIRSSISASHAARIALCCVGLSVMVKHHRYFHVGDGGHQLLDDGDRRRRLAGCLASQGRRRAGRPTAVVSPRAADVVGTADRLY